MYIFSYCPFLAPPIITSCYCIALVIRNSKPCGAPPLPATTDAALGPRAPAVLPLQLSVRCSELHPVSHFAYPHPQTDASCFYKSDVSLWLGFLVSVQVETRERDEPVALLWSDLEESTRDPTACGQQLPVFPSPWGSVCGCVRVDIYMCALHSWMYELEGVTKWRGS